MSDDSYAGALEAAGATVHECKWFGSYQGRWIADVTLPDGRRGLIADYYGSCSGCDAFEAEMSGDYHQYDKHKDYEFHADCEECQAHKAKLAKFGEEYFAQLTTADALAQEMAKDSYWSAYDEDKERADFILARVVDPEIRAALIARKEAPAS